MEPAESKAARVLTPLEAWGLLMPKTSSLVREVLRNCSARLPRGSVEFSVLAPVSFRLFTVTFHANHANNLTRSP